MFRCAIGQTKAPKRKADLFRSFRVTLLTEKQNRQTERQINAGKGEVKSPTDHIVFHGDLKLLVAEPLKETSLSNK